MRLIRKEKEEKIYRRSSEPPIQNYCKKKNDRDFTRSFFCFFYKLRVAYVTINKSEITGLL